MQPSKLLSMSDVVRSIGERGGLRRVVFTDGHFNIIHPGHLRFLKFCRQHGDILVAGVHSAEMLDPDRREYYFSQEERALSLAALDVVDFVVCLQGSTAEAIRTLAPQFFIKGVEFQARLEAIAPELQAASACNCRVVFGSGGPSYATDRLVERFPEQENERYRSFFSSCGREGIGYRKLRSTLESLPGVRLLMVGDTIVDRYIDCDPLGISSEAPVLAIRELEQETFVGGAAIVALNAAGLGGECSYLSVVGDDPEAGVVAEALERGGVEHHLIRDATRPTTFKTRYVVENQKVLRVSRLREHFVSREIEDEILDRAARVLPTVDGLVLSDFVYGVITPRVLDGLLALAREHGVRIVGDLQCSSQTGDVSKFRGISLITPTEKEARTALGDQTSGLEELARRLQSKTENEAVMLTLGAQGLLVFTPPSRELNRTDHSHYFCALEPQPKDVVGAGDALLAAASMTMCRTGNAVLAGAIGTCVAAVAVRRVGNVPVRMEEVAAQVSEMGPFQMKKVSSESRAAVGAGPGQLEELS